MIKIIWFPLIFKKMFSQELFSYPQLPRKLFPPPPQNIYRCFISIFCVLFVFITSLIFLNLLFVFLARPFQLRPSILSGSGFGSSFGGFGTCPQFWKKTESWNAENQDILECREGVCVIILQPQNRPSSVYPHKLSLFFNYFDLFWVLFYVSGR